MSSKYNFIEDRNKTYIAAPKPWLSSVLTFAAGWGLMDFIVDVSSLFTSGFQHVLISLIIFFIALFVMYKFGFEQKD